MRLMNTLHWSTRGWQEGFARLEYLFSRYCAFECVNSYVTNLSPILKSAFSLEVFDQDGVADLVAARDVEFLAVPREGILVDITSWEPCERSRSRSAKGL